MTPGGVTLIVGGGIAGLWLCDALRRRGDAVLLVESMALGAGQSIGSQGILHGGVKYALAGTVGPMAAEVRGMPARWAEFLAGRAEPDLSGVPVRALACHLWTTGGVRGTLGMLGARLALTTTPTPLDSADWPDALRGGAREVAELPEPVLNVPGLLAVLLRRNAGHLFAVAGAGGVRFVHGSDGQVKAVDLTQPGHGGGLRVAVRTVVLSAGAGTADLMAMLGGDPVAMQRRPLHMVLVRGDLPVLNGHCVDGHRPRVTITTVRDRSDRTVWQVGGQVAEDGVAMSSEDLARHARKELAAALPGFRWAGCEWATWRVDRAERATDGGQRPDDVGILRWGNVVAAWPTKLVLVPRLADRLLELIPPSGAAPPLPAHWPVPRVAVPPWDEEAVWTGGR